ncbi:transglycosylase SLT domain-containing protein [Geothermobacter hydrogeniphilus]|nr:transglycosylase SLT domain-containing protein [Geothermobacter hydrogeniphilus]
MTRKKAKISMFLPALAVVMLLSVPAHADIYKQVAPDGSITFTDTPTDNNWQLYFSRDSTVYDIIRFFADQYGLEEALVRAVIKVESDYDPSVVSSKGAMGMMQLVPTTAAEMDVVNPLDLVDNIRGGSRYLRKMLDRFHGDLDLALAAYNAGPGAVSRYGGVPPYAETMNYVRKVRKYLRIYRVEEESLM